MPEPMYFEHQAVEPGAPVVVRLRRDATFDEVVGVWELDTFCDAEGRRTVERPAGVAASPPPRLLGRFRIAARGGELLSVGPNAIADEPKPGRFQACWSGMHLVHVDGEQVVHGRAYLGGAARWLDDVHGVITGDRLRLTFRRGEARGHAALELIDPSTLRGHWWLDGEPEEDAGALDARRLLLVRDRPWSPSEPRSIRLPIDFQGATGAPVRRELQVPIDELLLEAEASADGAKTTAKAGRVVLELGLSRAADALPPADGYAEVAVAFDPALQRELGSASLFLHLWLWYTDLWPPERAAELWARVDDLARLVDGQPYGETHVTIRNAAVDAARAAEHDLHESIAFRMALGGLAPDGPNPFDPVSTSHFEFDWWRRNADQPAWRSARARGDELCKAMQAAQEKTRERAAGLARWLDQDHGQGWRADALAHVSFVAPPESLLGRPGAAAPDRDVAAAYAAGLAQARSCQDGALVKAFTALGLDDTSPDPFAAMANPYSELEARDAAAERRGEAGWYGRIVATTVERDQARAAWERRRARDVADFGRFQAIVRLGLQRRALAEGKKILELNRFGVEVGWNRAPSDPSKVRRLARDAGIADDAADRVYRAGLQLGEWQRGLRAAETWLREHEVALGEAIKGVAERLERERIERGGRTFLRHTARARLEAQLVARRASALADGVPAEHFEAVTGRLLETTLANLEQGVELAVAFEDDWLQRIVVAPAEWLGLGALSIIDSPSWAWHWLTGRKLYATFGADFIASCERTFEHSVFTRLTGDLSTAELWGMGFFGLSDAFLKVGVVVIAGQAVAALGRAGLTALGEGTLVEQLVAGGGRWVAGELLPSIGETVASSAFLGAGQEYAHAVIDGREFRFTNATRNMLVNSATFLAFHTGGAFFRGLGLGSSFEALVTFDMTAGFIGAGHQLHVVRQQDDPEAYREAMKGVADQAFMAMLLVGTPWIRRLVAERALRPPPPPSPADVRLGKTMREAAGQVVRPLPPRDVTAAVREGAVRPAGLRARGIASAAALEALGVKGPADLKRLGLGTAAGLAELHVGPRDLARLGVSGPEKVAELFGKGEAAVARLVEAKLCRTGSDLHHLGLVTERDMAALELEGLTASKERCKALKFDPRVDHRIEDIFATFGKEMQVEGWKRNTERIEFNRRSRKPEDWDLTKREVGDRIEQTITFERQGKPGEMANFTRAIEMTEAGWQLVFESAFAGEMPSFGRGEGDRIDFVPGRGWPIQLRATLEIVRNLCAEVPGLSPEKLVGFKGSNIQNIESCLVLQGAGTSEPGTPSSRLARTRSHQYIADVVKQLGFEIKGWDVTPATLATTMGRLLTENAAQAAYWKAPGKSRDTRLKSEFSITDDTPIYMGWNLYYQVERAPGAR